MEEGVQPLGKFRVPASRVKENGNDPETAGHQGLGFFAAMRAASAFRSCFLSTPSINSGSLLGVQPKQGTPNSEIFFARRSSKLGMPLSDKASRQITRTPDSTMSLSRRTNWA